MSKRIFYSLIVISLILGLCACSAKLNRAESLNGNEEKYFTAVNEETQNENPGASSVADPTVSTSNISLEKKRIIQDQSFHIKLNDWGNVRFISYEPANSIHFEDVSFFLTKDDHVIYSFPYYCENNSTENYVGLFDSVAAVDFRDVNNDNVKDVLIIINYITGAGPQGMIPRPRARIFLADKNKFYLATDFMDDITNNIEEKDLTIDAISEFLKNK